jgi:fructosamine-3-kinase
LVSNANTADSEEIVIECLELYFNTPVSNIKIHTIGGGCINETFRVTVNNNRKFFVKQNKVSRYPRLLTAELTCLKYLQLHTSIITPQIIGFKEKKDLQVLMLEWIEPGTPDKTFWHNTGAALAALHQFTSETNGFFEDNYIGSLPQRNKQHTFWVDFFIEQRLIPQLEIARSNDLIPKSTLQLFDQLIIKLPGILTPEPASLLHGDFWNGNIMCDSQSNPVFIDPCIYFGNRLMDIGMSRLFGGFNKTFYESYHYHYPLPKEYELQADVCNLYPLLVHLNLFGRHYLHKIDTVLNKLV